MNTTILELTRFPVSFSLKKTLLLSGILSSLLYGTMITGIQFEGYKFVSQSVSELSAIGVPTRNLWIALGILYQVLMIAFGFGVWLSANHRFSLHIVACLILLNYGIFSSIWPFASMQQREVLAEGGKTLTEFLHIVLVIAVVLCNLLTIGFGAAAFGKRFRYYSIITILIMIILGALTGPAAAARIEANLPTPWFGIWERIIILGFLLWIIVLAFILMPSGKGQHSINVTVPEEGQSRVFTRNMIRQPVWQRIILLIVLGYEGLGALSGGILLVAEPDGRLMDMPVEIMHGIFNNFLVPGLILTVLGILNTAAFIAVLLRSRIDWLLAGLGLGGLTVWFIVEIIILKEFHWLHAMWGLPVLGGCLVVIPLILSRRLTLFPVQAKQLKKNIIYEQITKKKINYVRAF